MNKTFVRNGRPNDKLVAMSSMISQSFKVIEDAKARYLETVCWSLLKSVRNKTRVPNIPSLLENDKFVLYF